MGKQLEYDTSNGLEITTPEICAICGAPSDGNRYAVDELRVTRFRYAADTDVMRKHVVAAKLCEKHAAIIESHKPRTLNKNSSEQLNLFEES